MAFAVDRATRVLKLALLGRDALRADDTAWALVPAPPRLHALLVSSSPGQLLRALQAIPGLSVSVTAPAAYQDSSFTGQDLVVFDSYMPANLPPVPLLLTNPPQDNGLITVQSSNVFLPISSIESADPLVAGLDLNGLATTGQSLETPSWATVAVGGPRGPLILHGVQNGQPTAILAFDAGHGAFSGDLAFPLLVSRLVQWLEPQPPAGVAVGARIWLPPDVQSVRDPGNAILSGPLVTAAAPGIYRVAAASGGLLPGDPLFAAAQAGPGDSGQEAVGIPAWVPSAPGGTFTLALWPLLILLALVALGGEWWFYAHKT